MENFEKNEKKMRKLSHHFVVIMVIFVKEKLLFMVQIGGLEPPQIAPYTPQAYVSTNSTTWASIPAAAGYQVCKYSDYFVFPKIYGKKIAGSRN